MHFASRQNSFAFHLLTKVGDARQAVGNDDDDEDHAFGNDKDYGAGALDKPDRGNHGGMFIVGSIGDLYVDFVVHRN